MVVLGGWTVPYERGTSVQGFLDINDVHRPEGDPSCTCMLLGIARPTPVGPYRGVCPYCREGSAHKERRVQGVLVIKDAHGPETLW